MATQEDPYHHLVKITLHKELLELLIIIVYAAPTSAILFSEDDPAEITIDGDSWYSWEGLDGADKIALADQPPVPFFIGPTLIGELTRQRFAFVRRGPISPVIPIIRTYHPPAIAPDTILTHISPFFLVGLVDQIPANAEIPAATIQQFAWPTSPFETESLVHIDEDDSTEPSSFQLWP